MRDCRRQGRRRLGKEMDGASEVESGGGYGGERSEREGLDVAVCCLMSASIIVIISV